MFFKDIFGSLFTLFHSKSLHNFSILLRELTVSRDDTSK